MDMNDSDYVIIFTTEITSISTNFKKLWIISYLKSSYSKTIYNDEEENIDNIFIIFVELLLDYINHPALVEEWKINIDVATY